MDCAACGTTNDAGRGFCIECGSSLERACPSCGAVNPPAAKFCGECGAPLSTVIPDAASERSPASAVHRAAAGLHLFLDLVGFTTLSEQRDAEDMRVLLDRYFQTAQKIIERHGGVVEKFIGLCMVGGVGTPTTREDDAERAGLLALSCWTR